MRVTEKKTVKIERCIPDNPFQVRWLNPLGGFDTWVFGKRQQEDYNIKDTDTFTPSYDYLQITDGLEQTLAKDAFEEIMVGYENLKTEDVEGIKHILKSPLVYYVSGTPGSNDFIQLQIRVKQGSYSIIDTGESKHSMEITFIVPKLLTQSN